MLKRYDAHQEMLIMPYKTGVRILRPTNRYNYHQRNHTTIADVLATSCSTYFLDRENKVVNCNLINSRIMYMDSISETVGKSLDDTPYPKENVLQIHANDHRVIMHQKGFYFEEYFYKENENSNPLLCIKLPIFSDENTVLGIFGFGIDMRKQSAFIESLSAITQMGFIPSFNTKMQTQYHCAALEAEKIYLTPREIELLKLIVNGKICPEIANEMKLSKRTIEHYIVRLREKFNVESKQALIEKAIYLMRDYHLSP